MAETDADSPLAPLVAAWSSAADDVLALTAALDDEAMATPTDLPGWTVQDVLAHLAALEAELAGDPLLEVPDDALPSDALANPFKAHTERGVAARRGRSAAQVQAELASAVERRRTALAADLPSDPNAPAAGVAEETWSWETLLRNRVIDLWMHEQDIRRAVGRPGGFDTLGAQVTVMSFAVAMPFVLGRRVKPASGAVVRWRVGEGADAWDVAVRMDDDGRARVVGSDVPADAEILMTTEDFVCACGGRREVSPAITGDTDLARRVLESMAVTP